MFKVGDKVIIVSTETTKTRHGLVPYMKAAFENGTVIEVTRVRGERIFCMHESFNWSFCFASSDLMLANKTPTLCPVIAMKDAQGGVKYDNGKADLSLLSYEALSEISRAFEFGAKKYGRYNYLGGMEWTRIISALLRHAYAFAWGEDNDKESGLSHLAHCGACVIMLLDFSTKKLGSDNRYKK